MILKKRSRRRNNEVSLSPIKLVVPFGGISFLLQILEWSDSFSKTYKDFYRRNPWLKKDKEEEVLESEVMTTI